MKNRSKADIAYAVLREALDGALMTDIMFGSYLTIIQLRKYLGELMDSGALAYVAEERRYFTTDLGKRYVSTYEEMVQLLYPSSFKPNGAKIAESAGRGRQFR